MTGWSDTGWRRDWVWQFIITLLQHELMSCWAANKDPTKTQTLNQTLNPKTQTLNPCMLLQRHPRHLQLAHLACTRPIHNKSSPARQGRRERGVRYALTSHKTLPFLLQCWPRKYGRGGSFLATMDVIAEGQAPVCQVQV